MPSVEITAEEEKYEEKIFVAARKNRANQQSTPHKSLLRITALIVSSRLEPPAVNVVGARLSQPVERISYVESAPLLFETSSCFVCGLIGAMGRERPHSNPLPRDDAEVTSPRLLRLDG